MSSIISPRYDEVGVPLIALNDLQIEMLDRFNRKVDDGTYTFEETRCPCGAKEDVVLAERDRFGLATRNVVCRSCGLVRLNPRLTADSYGRFYDSEYRPLYVGATEDSYLEKTFQAQVETGEAILAFLGREAGFDAGPCDVLEMGTSCGGILAAFARRGHRCVGLDYDETYMAFGRSRHGLDLRRGDTASFMAASFDLVIFSHVFEHLTDPMEQIGELSRILRAGSLLFIHVPGIKFETYYRKPPFDFLYYLQNAHAFTFTKATLENLFRESRFSLVYADDQVRAVYRLTDSANPSPNGAVDWTNEYDDVVSFIRSVEARRPLRQTAHRLRCSAPVQWTRAALRPAYRRIRSGLRRSPEI